MAGFPKRFSDPRLARKICLLRSVFVLLQMIVIAGVLIVASSGEMLARASLSGARADSRASTAMIAWADSPVTYIVVTLWHIASISLFVVGLYLALARLIEKFHGRPFFRRKYPY